MSDYSRPVRKLTTVSHVLLGYLALRPTTAYDLAKRMRGSGAALVWPRTRSRIYEEPKNLVAHGLATAESESHRGRRRTIYTISPAGCAALREWLTEPAAGPSTEDEALLKVFYASFGDLSSLHAHLAEIRTDLDHRYTTVAATLEALTEGDHPFPEREHLTSLLIHHVVAQLDARSEWLERTEAVVADWPDTLIDDARRDHARADNAELLTRVRGRAVTVSG